ncbi:MAG: exodeoxyribonuclease VII large subunit [Puniceicoccales bacterium]|nr:exodeoxyribonuclease VII large subunit [Puniceicoccales bacterium]
MIPPTHDSPETWDTEKIYSISSLTERIQSLLGSQIPMLWIGGEVSNLRQQSSGHLYFTLQDERSQIACVLFRGDALRLHFPLENGKSILCYGSLELYAPRGQYQWIVRHLLPCGTGQRDAEFQKLKERCRREGLFDAERKRPIPPTANPIALLSSPTGAALQDFLQILRRKDWRGEIILFPCRVQGDESVRDFLHNLDLAQRSPAELIVLARGGGSAEDLWTFNAEALVRKLADCPKPILSAIGHETDFTLVDFVADLRAETPSAAAEIIATNYQNAQRRCWDLRERLAEIFEEYTFRQRQHWQFLRQRLRNVSPERQIEHRRHQLQQTSQRFFEGTRSALASKREELLTLRRRWESYDIGRNLRSGFLIAENFQGKILRHRRDVPPGGELILHFQDGPLKVCGGAPLDEPSLVGDR